MLCDRRICGINDDRIQRSLLSEKDQTFETPLEWNGVSSERCSRPTTKQTASLIWEHLLIDPILQKAPALTVEEVIGPLTGLSEIRHDFGGKREDHLKGL